MIEFPPAFISFLKDNIEYISELDKPIQRTIRVKEGIGLSDLQKDLKTSDISKVDWFSNCFYQLDASIRLASSALYENGLIYGMDITSAVAVAALSISPNDHVLDLCCAPGAKTCYISELLGTSGTGTVTGVDLSKERLSICKSLARKYKLEKYRLFHADGTTFDICAPSRIGSTILMHPQSQHGSIVKPFHASKLIRNDLQIKHDKLFYDKVLVDAECTHDGSIFHLIKQNSYNWSSLGKIIDPEKLKNLEGLQRKLIFNGFRILKPGGILVYSTCSFFKSQNEDIVSWLVQTCDGQAVIEPIPDYETFPLAPTVDPTTPCLNSEYMIRFSPKHSNTSGLFIARIKKLW